MEVGVPQSFYLLLSQLCSWKVFLFHGLLFFHFSSLHLPQVFCLFCFLPIGTLVWGKLVLAGKTSSWMGLEEGCKSIVEKINSSGDGLYLSHGLAILSNALPSNWELSLHFSVCPRVFPSNSACCSIWMGKVAPILLLLFWAKMTLQICGMKLGLCVCFSIQSIFFVLLTSFCSFQSILDTEVLWNGIQATIFLRDMAFFPLCHAV